MANDEIMIFLVCINKGRGKLQFYIPDIDFETRASNYTKVLNKARDLIRAAFVIGDLNSSIVQEDLCSLEKLPAILKEKQMEKYLDAQIVFVDLNMKEIRTPGMSDITLRLPQGLVTQIERECIDYEEIFETTLLDILRKKHIFNLIKEWTGKTVEVKTYRGNYIGEIKAIKYKNTEPWEFSLSLKTSIYNSITLYSAMIEEVSEIPVVMNKMGTFHLVDQLGRISLAGRLWWKEDHIDIYLEYDPSKEIDDQETFEYLSEFNMQKYILDEYVRQSIAKQLINKTEILLLFQDYMDEDPQMRDENIVDQLINRIELCFINISANKDVYLDYNFKNEIGSFNVGVTKNLSSDSFMYIVKDVTFFDMEEED